MCPAQSEAGARSARASGGELAACVRRRGAAARASGRALAKGKGPGPEVALMSARASLRAGTTRSSFTTRLREGPTHKRVALQARAAPRRSGCARLRLRLPATMAEAEAEAPPPPTAAEPDLYAVLGGACRAAGAAPQRQRRGARGRNRG